MESSNKNFVLAYIVLVGVPLLGLAGILGGGRKLSAPVSVSGSWKVSADQDRFGTNPCAKVLSGSNAAFTISQSGKSFVLSVARSSLAQSSGTIEGTTLRADLTPIAVSHDPACSTKPLSLIASVDSTSDPHSLHGVLRVENCSSWDPIEFQGTRDEQPKAKGIH